jgi:hypothetical protein
MYAKMNCTVCMSKSVIHLKGGEGIKMKSMKLKFKKNKIIIHNQGEYKGCNGKIYTIC